MFGGNRLVDFSQYRVRGYYDRSREFGAQFIPGDVRLSPFGPEQAQLPRTFVFTGQRFVTDGCLVTSLGLNSHPHKT